MARIHPVGSPRGDMHTHHGAETDFDECDAAREARSTCVTNLLTDDPDGVSNIERVLSGSVEFRSSFSQGWFFFWGGGAIHASVVISAYN